MKRTVVMLALVSVLGLGLLTSNSFAAGATGRGGFRMFDSFDVVGTPTRDSNGELIGFINEVMVDSEGHALAVICHETAAGEDPAMYGDVENTPVPFEELTISKATGSHKVAVLKTDLKHLNFAPYLDPLKMQSRGYETRIYEYYGIQPYWTQSST